MQNRYLALICFSLSSSLLISSTSQAGTKETVTFQVWANALKCLKAGTECTSALANEKPKTVSVQLEKSGQWYTPERHRQKLEIGSTPFEYDVIVSKCPDHNSRSGYVYKFELALKNLMTRETNRATAVTEAHENLNEITLRAPSIDSAGSTFDPFLKISGPSQKLSD